MEYDLIMGNWWAIWTCLIKSLSNLSAITYPHKNLIERMSVIIRLQDSVLTDSIYSPVIGILLPLHYS